MFCDFFFEKCWYMRIIWLGVIGYFAMAVNIKIEYHHVFVVLGNAIVSPFIYSVTTFCNLTQHAHV